MYKRKNEEPGSSLGIIQVGLLSVKVGLAVLAFFFAVGFAGYAFDMLYDDVHVFVEPFEIDMSEYETYNFENGEYHVEFYGDENAVILVNERVVVNTHDMPSPYYTRYHISGPAEVRIIDGDHRMNVNPLDGAGKITKTHPDKAGSLVISGIIIVLCIGFIFGLYKAD